MDVVALSRLQFAITIAFHFIFVPLSIGLGLIVAITETRYVRTGDARYRTLAQFWGKLLAINFALGVVTGLTMEFQFGTNWSRYAEFMGDIFGSPLAFEALMAFFLESTFISAWIFGWDRLSKTGHLFAAWMIVVGTHLSAVWIILANGFMQNPVGYVLQNGRAEMVNFGALLTNPYAWHMYIHTILSTYVVGGFFVLGVSAYHLLQRNHVELFRTSFRLALIVAFVGTVGVIGTGHLNGQNVARLQPSKLAAMEAVWNTQAGVPMYLWTVPDQANQGNSAEAFAIPGLTSWLATGNANATIKGLNEFPKADQPPVAPTFWSFRLMVGLGGYLLLMVLAGFYFDRRGGLLEKPLYLRMLLYSIPLPYVAIDLGWMVAEIGRQPWTVFGLMRTANSVSPVPASHVVMSLVGLTALYAVLMGLDIYFLMRTSREGPAPSSSTREIRTAKSATVPLDD